MSDGTGIEWTDATWNPLVGCTKISPGCENCYAEGVVNRFVGTSAAFPARFDTVTLRGQRFLSQPLRWRKPRRVFVNSLSDLFYKDVPDEFIARVFAVMALAPQHTFQLLTKRHGRMRALLSSEVFQGQVQEAAQGVVAAYAPVTVWDWSWPLSNVWLGVSVEDQKRADLRIPALLGTPAAIRWISAEPLLGPIDLTRLPFSAWTGMSTGQSAAVVDAVGGRYGVPGMWQTKATGLDWVICGGESGPGARPMHQDWARLLRDQCESASVPYLFKQWGDWRPLADDQCAVVGDKWPTGTWGVMSRRVGKKVAGRELDGRLHDGYPQQVSA